MISLPHASFELDNGLRVVLHRDDASPIVCLTMLYNVGSKDETAGRSGFAHLFEHLMFEGSANVPRGAFDRHCELAGGYNNAYTSEDKTCYYMMLPANHLELGLWLESDRLADLCLTGEGLETQRSVVIEEKRQRVDNQPYGTLDTKLSMLLYPDHPYGHPVIGSTGDLEAAAMEDVAAFHRTWYRPDNAALALAGDIDIDEAAGLVRKWFEGISGRRNASPPRETPLPGRNGACETVIDAVPLPGVFLGFQTPPERDADFLALDIAAEAFGSGEACRLHKSLVYDKRIASQAAVLMEPRRFGGMLLAHAIAAPGRTAVELEAALREEVGRMRDCPPSEAEYLRARNRIEAQYVQQLHSLAARADRFAHHALFDGDASIVETLLDEYLGVSRETVVEAVRQYLDPETAVMITYLPSDEGERCASGAIELQGVANRPADNRME